jgi:chemotaxis protein CheD
MKRLVTINIGGFYATGNPTVITTLLGPCVAVCLHDPVTGIGGMNHILLPGKAEPEDAGDPSRYSVDATEMLISETIKLGAGRHNLTAKVFGGAHVLKNMPDSNSIGKKISASVADCLNHAGIRIIEQDLGGNKVRKIFLHTDTGEVLLKHPEPACLPLIAIPKPKEGIKDYWDRASTSIHGPRILKPALSMA